MHEFDPFSTDNKLVAFAIWFLLLPFVCVFAAWFVGFVAHTRTLSENVIYIHVNLYGPHRILVHCYVARINSVVCENSPDAIRTQKIRFK